jgi:PilS N terminal
MDQIISRFVVMGAVLIALVGVLWGGWEVTHKSQTSTASGDESQMSQNIHALYQIGSAGNYSNISNTSAINGGLIPQAMLNGDGTSIVGPWSGSRVVVSSVNGGTGYQSAWTGVAAKDCATLARSQTPDGGVEVNGQLVNVTGTGSDISSQVANDCAASSASPASVTFIYDN